MANGKTLDCLNSLSRVHEPHAKVMKIILEGRAHFAAFAVARRGDADPAAE